jgi:hemolysin activation/secretion protein
MAGVSVDSTLVPGASVGTSDLVIEANQTGTFGGSVDYDNFGNKFTGSSRVGASLNFNNPARIGDQVALRVMTSGSGLDYARASYLVPVGSAGTKIGAAYSHMNYKLGGDFSAIDGEGNAEIASLYAVHPIIRSRNNNLYGQLGYDDKHMVDNAGGQLKDDKRDHLWNLGLSGDSRDGFGSGGMNSYSATFSSGNLSLDQPSLLIDSTSTQTNGSFSKTDYSVSRLQRMTDNFSLYAAFSGQTASKNLDSSEKFILGGAGGIRAYPQGEASGDEGQLLNIELRRDLGAFQYGNMQLIGFYDAGNITLNKNTWTNWQGTNPALTNSYSLSGAGIGINLSKAGGGDTLGGYSVKAYLAAKLGTNAGRDALGHDSDGANSSTRFWLQANKWF